MVWDCLWSDLSSVMIIFYTSTPCTLALSRLAVFLMPALSMFREFAEDSDAAL